MECPNCHSETPDDSAFCSRCGSGTHKDGSIPPLNTQTLSILGLDFQEGQIIANKYKVKAVIGRGGMGVVYKAEDIILKRCVALKFLRAEFLIDAEAKNRFLLEAQVSASIDHPNICPVYEVNEEHGRTFIVMPFIEGESLRESNQKGLREFAERLSLAIQVAEGLSEAHKKGIIHRDIKPANIMVTERHQAKIMDFGLAKFLQGSNLTTTAKVMGTVSYMSPEQARGDAVNPLTDVWSLGVVLYELFTGRLPFEKKQNHALMYAIIYEAPRPIRQIKSDLPELLEAAIDRCLQKDPDDRYADAEALARDLKNIQLRLGLGPDESVLDKTRKLAPARKKWAKVILPLAAAVVAVLLGIRLLTREAPVREAAPAPKPPPAAAAPAGPSDEELNKIRESYLENRYAETAQLAQSVLAKYPAHPVALEFQKRARGALLSAQIAPILSSGKASFQRGDFAQCIKDMERVLALDRNHSEAQQYLIQADAVLSKGDILSLVERHRKAEESKAMEVILSDVGSPALRRQWQDAYRTLFNGYDAITSMVSDPAVTFDSRTEATVTFSHRLRAVYKKDGKNKNVGESSETWHLRKQGKVWQVVGTG
jgi:tRNA A-37 threonylcarbamoyl transferase component Bud32